MGASGRFGRWCVVLVAPVAVVATLLPAPAAAQVPQPPSLGVSPEVIAQIEAIERDKATRTPAEQKLDDRLLYSSRRSAGEVPVEGAPQLQTAAEVKNGLTEVDIEGRVSPRLLALIDELDGEIVVAVESAGAVRARIPLDAITALSEDRDVDHMRAADEAVTNSIEGLGQAIGSVDPGGPIANAGSVTSQGDVTHAAATARSTLGVNGSGVQIGVLSDGVNSLAARQASGDLPSVTVLPGQAGSGDEGTAMLEIVHDLAPGAQLFFATAFTSQASFAQNILALRAAGCDVIVDDVTYFAEAVFQPDDVEQAVDQVVADGAVYLSSAGNSGNVVDGTSGTWTGDFVNSGTTAFGITGGTLHDFNPTAAVQVQNQMTSVNTVDGTVVNLAWADPLGASSNDYDLFIINSQGTAVFASSTVIQNGNDDPLEQAVATTNGQRILVLRKTAAQDRFLSVVTNRAKFIAGGGTPLSASFQTGGASYGHNSGASAITLAATPVQGAFGAGSPTGPFPNPHNSGNLSETFSSDGPRRDFFLTNGTPITPGNFGSAGGQTRSKPDITAGDGGLTTTPGFIPFYGTSASAPHAAAIAALVLDANPALTPAQVKAAMTGTAIDIEAPGVDNVTGSGIVMATDAVSAVLGPPAGAASFSAPTYSIGEAGPTVTITVNRAGGSAGAASVQVAVAAGGSATGGGTDFTFSSPQTVNWAAGDSAPKTVAVGITQDPADEPNETVNLVLQNPTTVSLGSPIAATLTIVDDDGPPPALGTVRFNVGSSSISEGGGTGIVTINRIGGATGAGTVQVARTGGNATSGSDFTFTSPVTVSFADGQITATTTVAIVNDTTTESAETVVLALQNPTGGLAVGSPSAQTLTIVDNELVKGGVTNGMAQFSLTTSSVAESGPQATLQITRSGGSTGAVAVQVSLTGITATAGSDVTFSSPATVNFASGQTTATVPVPIVDDASLEPSEIAQFTLQNPTGGLSLGSAAVHNLTINDNDVAPSPGFVGFASPGAPTGVEGGPPASLVLQRTGGSSGAVSVEVVVGAGGSATVGSDYVFSSPVVVPFANGQTSATVPVPIVDDATVEPLETAFFVLQNPTGGLAVVPELSGTTLVITDNDVAPSPGFVGFASPGAPTGVEGGPPASLVLQRTGGSSGAVSVEVVVGAGGSATVGSDYVFSSPVVVPFANGQTSATVPVPIVDDATVEPLETAFFVLQNPTGGLAVVPELSATTLVITDNDSPPPPPGSLGFSVGASSVSEGGGSATLTISRVGGSAGAGTVQVARTGGTATVGSDFTFASPVTVNFANGQTTATVPVPIVNNTVGEPSETVVFALQNPTGGLTLGAPIGHTLTIIDNDGKGGGAAVQRF